jgi:CheY-like chemotaxis protein
MAAATNSGEGYPLMSCNFAPDLKATIMKKHTILWADDDPDDLALMREALQQTDQRFELVEAHNGRKALDYLDLVKHQKDFPCLIVLDLNMPVLNGRDTLAIIKSEEEYHSIPVVVFTTSGNEADRAFCSRFGVDMLTKPPSFEGLKQVAQKIVSLCAIEINARESCS